MQVAYGHQITSDEDLYLQVTEDIGHALGNAGSPGSTPVDFFPILKYFPSWFPGAYYAGFARSQRGAIRKLHDYPFANVKAELAAGTAKPSFVSHGGICPRYVTTLAAAKLVWKSPGRSIICLVTVLDMKTPLHCQLESRCKANWSRQY
ncbi:hypothetical protein C0995_014219 [Termitomyces sp. Mi166|nr:hypothetical protein C0995_014219 [Termitomyces sp. Mi166\